MNSQKRVVAFLGVAALGTLGGLSPWVYRRIRVDTLIARLESGDDAASRAELVKLGGVDRAGERLAATRHTGLAQNFVELAGERRLKAADRQIAFDIAYPLHFEFGADAGPYQHFITPAAQWMIVSVKAKESNWELVDSCTPGNYWDFAVLSTTLGPGKLIEHVQYFTDGDRGQERLIYQRAIWVLDAPDPTGKTLGYRTVTQDLTPVPDPINLYLRRPLGVILPTGESALELRLASMGTWRQFVPGRRLYDGSVAYSVHLDRSESKQEPFLLGRVAVSAEKGLGQWFAEDAVLKKRLENMDRGSHWIDFHVPRSAAKLSPLGPFKLLFRPAPSFAQELGFEISETECVPFERAYYLPAPEGTDSG